MTTILTVKCASCSEKRDIKPGELGPADFPMCPKCGMPMLPKEAKAGVAE